MNKYITLLLFAFTILFSCAPKSFFSEDIKLEGTFVQKDAKWIQLLFTDDNFIFINNIEPIRMTSEICCDTISYGKWKMDSRGLIILNTPQKFENDFFMSMQVSEFRKYSQDSLYFIINNPIEEFYKKNDWKERNIVYKISPNSSNIRYTSNKISIPKVNGLELKDFTISVLVDPEITYRLSNLSVVKIDSEFYELRSSTANVFEVYIPDVSFEFLSLKMLKDDYVKIINSNKLLWDGKEYIRKK